MLGPTTKKSPYLKVHSSRVTSSHTLANAKEFYCDGSLKFITKKLYDRRSQWPRRLRRMSMAARLLRSWVLIPPGAWIFVCCVLSGRVFCDELITRPEESSRLWRVVVWSQSLVNEEAIARAGLQSPEKIINKVIIQFVVKNCSLSTPNFTATHQLAG
jgi:hypothetical protein